MSDTTKPRFRVSAGSSRATTFDSFQNFAASLGYGASNTFSGGTYGFNPITRNHTLLEWAYRGSWLVKNVVDAVADDMTRAGVDIESDMPPDDIDKMMDQFNQLMVWQRLNETIKWSRLYGGCIAVIMIDGQATDTPLRLNTIGKDQFRGLMVLDRWMIWPHLEDPVKDLGQDFGMPKYYEVVSDAKAIPHMKVHYSRCIRFEGIELPYWQKIAENMWGLSVIEPLYDRLLAFDSTSSGAAQLVFRAHLRTLKIEKLRELIAFGGTAYEAVLEQLRMIRLMQANEALTVLDASDEFETNQYAFGGLSDVMIQFAQQLSGAAQIPLVRLFGQSPAGLNATGDSDIRNYYDAINAQQEARMRRPIGILMDVVHRSLFGKPLPDGFNYSFAPLWQLADTEKAQVALQVTQAVDMSVTSSIIPPHIALKELRQSSKITGVWSNITDEDIEEAKNTPPPMQEQGGDQPGQEAAPKQGEPNASQPPAQPGEGNKPTDKDAITVKPPRFTPIQRAKVMKLLKGPDHVMLNKHDVIAHYAMDGTTKDTLPPMKVIHGITVTIETPKGTRRQGNGWSVQMPSDYGYINGTSSAEGPHEQLDCFVGDDHESTAVWLVEQHDPDTGEFDEHKFLLGFPDRDTAMDAYHNAFNDGKSLLRVGSVKRMSINALKSFIEEWQPGALNGAGHGATQLEA